MRCSSRPATSTPRARCSTSTAASLRPASTRGSSIATSCSPYTLGPGVYHLRVTGRRSPEYGATYALTARANAIDIPDRVLYHALAPLGQDGMAPTVTDLVRLRSLAVSESRLADLTGLDLALNLETLVLHDNQIVDIALLLRMTWLRFVDLRGNPLGDESIDAHLPALRERGVWVVTEDDHGDLPETATALAWNGRAEGIVYPITDKDVFRVALPRQADLSLFTTGEADTLGRLFYAKGELVAQDDDAGAGSNYTVIASQALPRGVYGTAEVSARRSGRFSVPRPRARLRPATSVACGGTSCELLRESMRRDAPLPNSIRRGAVRDLERERRRRCRSAIAVEADALPAAARSARTLRKQPESADADEGSASSGAAVDPEGAFGVGTLAVEALRAPATAPLGRSRRSMQPTRGRGSPFRTITARKASGKTRTPVLRSLSVEWTESILPSTASIRARQSVHLVIHCLKDRSLSVRSKRLAGSRTTVRSVASNLLDPPSTERSAADLLEPVDPAGLPLPPRVRASSSPNARGHGRLRPVRVPCRSSERRQRVAACLPRVGSWGPSSRA